MADSVLFPSAVDYVRILNTNAVDNLLARQKSYTQLPSLYQRAYMLVHETGEVPMVSRFKAPVEETRTYKVPITIDPRAR